MKFRKIALVLVILLFLGLFSFASFVPLSVSAVPHQLDVMFAFDLSSSMSDDLAAAKAMAKAIMDCLNLEDAWLDVRFGLITYVDYPYYYDYCGYAAQYGVAPDYPYALNVPLTYDKTLVKGEIDALGLFWGADEPQDHARIMYEGYSDPLIGWRSECTVKIMVDFSDSVPHDHNLNEGIAAGVWNTGVDPGRDAIAGTADDIDLQDDAIPGLVANDIEWFEIHGTGIGLFEWGFWASWTHGKAYDLYTTTVSQVNADIVNKVIEHPPKKLDVMFCFDLSGSMSDDIAAAKAMAKGIMDCLNAMPWLDVRFGLISYVDYNGSYTYCGYSALYGGPTDYPYLLHVPLTYIKSTVKTAIDALSIFWGADTPQDHARVMYEGYSDPLIGWRSECTVKIMVDFSDSVPHDCNLNEGIAAWVWTTGRDPGRDAIVGTADDIDLQVNAIPGLFANDIEWFEIHGTGIGLYHWGFWASWTNGRAYDLYATTVTQVNDDIVNKVIAHQKPPVDVELWPREVVDLGDPRYTYWHELHPVKSNIYELTSWEPSRVLSPRDQIKMNETWFEVDEVTVDIKVTENRTGKERWLEYKCGYWVFRKEVEKMPISSKWNELKPNFTLCWHLTSWKDNGDSKLSPCDYIDMTLMYPSPGAGEVRWFHVDNVTVTLKLTQKPVEPPLKPYWLEFMGTLDEFLYYEFKPVCTLWHEILPVQGRIWHLSLWEDSPVLSPSDQVDLTDEHGITRWYHVDKLTVAMNMTSIEGLWRIVKFEGSLEQFKKYHWENRTDIPGPVSTQWLEVNPNYSRQWHLTAWGDANKDRKLSPCDYINMTDKETGLSEWFHVETLSTDMWLRLKIHDVKIVQKTLRLPFGASAVYNMGKWHVNITVTVENQGDFSETSNVTVYYDGIAIETRAVTMAPGATATLTFTWKTKGVTPCTYNYSIPTCGYIPYTISAEASVVPGETNTANNRRVDGTVTVRKPGDATCDGHVKGDDLGVVGASWYQTYPSPNYWWQADFTGDGRVFGDDLGVLGWYWYTDC